MTFEDWIFLVAGVLFGGFMVYVFIMTIIEWIHGRDE